MPLLEAAGHRALAIDLPGHGDDTTSFLRIGLGSYARCIEAAAAALPEPPVLVGHSMGGVAISAADARAPGRYRGLVYLCAFVPLAGDSVIGLARQDERSLVAGSIRRRLLSVRVRPGAETPLFYAACPPQDAAAAVARLRPDPAFPLLQRFPRGRQTGVPRAYLACERDRALSVERQRAMAARAGIERIASLDTDHSPFYSAPRQLVARLLELTAWGPGPELH